MKLEANSEGEKDAERRIDLQSVASLSTQQRSTQYRKDKNIDIYARDPDLLNLHVI